MIRWWRKLKCYFGKHEMTTVVLVNEKDEICRGHFCLFCDTYKITEVDDEQIIPVEETDLDQSEQPRSCNNKRSYSRRNNFG